MQKSCFTGPNESFYGSVFRGWLLVRNANFFQPIRFLYREENIIFKRYVYVSVNLCNQAIRELTETFMQFVKCLFQSVNLFFYACKTLKPGLFWYAVEREPVRLASTNPKKNSQTWDALWWGAKPPTKKNIYILIFFLVEAVAPY